MEDAMPVPGETGSTEEDFRCPQCGEMFPTDGKDENDCPVCGTHCTRDKCLVLKASDVGF
jgi:rubrerythrin